MVVGGILSLANSTYVGHVNLEVQLVTITLILAREGYAFHRQEKRGKKQKRLDLVVF